MMDGAADLKRVKFYGAADLASHWHLERIAYLIAHFDTTDVPPTVVDAIELHNVHSYIEAGVLPLTYSPRERATAEALAPQLRAAVSKFFFGFNDTNVAARLSGIPYYYRFNLLELLGRNRAFERCTPEVMLPALTEAGVNLAEMLDCKKLVSTYDSHIRDALLADARNAEHLIRKYLQKDVSSELYVPKNFTSFDAKELLSNYLDSEDANLNFVRLIETAPIDVQTGIDARLKLKAKRRSQRMVEELFREESAMKIKTGAEVRLSDSQREPAKTELDDMVTTHTYSRSWLDGTLDKASILNNFQHLFEFADDHALLTLPSYPSELGVFERFMTTTGRRDYQIGAAFRAKEISSLLQTRLYQDYLSSKDIDLETVISWFFDSYLVEEFGALNFSFAPSAPASSFLEKARHLFAEMEGIVNQFRLYVQEGELDRELLALTSDPVAYRQIPSLLNGKYVYATDHEEIHGVLHTLFSDQSGLTYINDTLHDSSAARLLVRNEISYTDFAVHQQSIVDKLIHLRVLEDTGARVQIAKTEQFGLLYRLFARNAATYHRLSREGRTHVDAFEARGWVTRSSSLLTEAEASYFNYFLNKTEFSNGPELRNKYLHGSQAASASESEHFQTYLTSLKMLIALVIKINDEFCLSMT